METYDKKAAQIIERSYQTPEIVNQRIETLQALGLSRGESILDVGCGTGLLLEMEAKAVDGVGRAEGIDFSDDMLEVARDRCANLAQVNLQQGSAESLPFEDASFDALSCTQTLLYVKNLQSALDEFYRVLKPGGRLAIIETDWNGAVINSSDADLTRRIFSAWDGAVVNPHLPPRLRGLLRASGFSLSGVKAVPVLNSSYSENSFSATMLRNFATTAARHKAVSEEESESWLAGQLALAERDEFFFCVNRFLFQAIR